MYNDIKVWLLKDFKIKLYSIGIVLGSSLILFMNKEIPAYGEELYPIIYLVLIGWIYYTFLYEVGEVSGKKLITLRKTHRSGRITQYLMLITILIFFGNKSFFLYGKLGVIVILFIITITWGLVIYYTIQHYWDGSFIVSLPRILFASGVFTYIYFIPWKNTYSSEFGINQIGHLLEADNYSTQYMVEIKKAYQNKVYMVPAQLYVSSENSIDEGDEDQDGNYHSKITRYIKIQNVEFNNKSKLSFNSCLLELDYNSFQSCEDLHGRQWEVKLTKTKIE